MGLIFKICDSGHEIQLPYRRQTQKKNDEAKFSTIKN